MKPPTMFGAACIGLTVALSACSSSSGHVVSAGGELVGRHGVAITVGSFNFPESVLLAEIYGQALVANNFPVRIPTNVGPRELVDPALINAVSARHTIGSLRSLDAQVVLDGRRPRAVAEAWLRAQGLLRTGGVGH